MRAGRRHGRAARDDGQVLVLVIGVVLVALALVTAVVSATGVHLDRTRLVTLADGAALAAADSLAEDLYYTADGPDVPVLLTDESVSRAVADYVARHAPAGLGPVAVLDASTPDGRSVQVRLGAVVRPVLVSVVTAPWSDGIALEAASSARAW